MESSNIQTFAEFSLICNFDLKETLQTGKAKKRKENMRISERATEKLNLHSVAWVEESSNVCFEVDIQVN